MPTPQRLEMRNISIAFAGVPVLHQVDLNLAGGSVMALTGANGAGKSTLMAVLSGAHAHYQGEIWLNGEPVTIRSPADAKKLGIHLVQQEVDVALVANLTVAENILLDQLASGGFAYNWRQIYRRASELLAQLDLQFDVRQRLDQCSLAQKQQILLARALSHHCRFLILDEPTAPLDQQESEKLFAVVRNLQESGIGVVFISHRIHELRAVCDQLGVLRDGRMIESGPMGSLTGEQIVEKMIGHHLEEIYPPRRPSPWQNEVLLQVEGLSDKHLLRDISFTLRAGEILGIAGLAGAGKSELCKALFGASPSQIKSATYLGAAWQPRSPYHATQQGMALVPEERRKEGIFIDESVAMNLSASADNKFSRLGIFSQNQSVRWALELIERLGIRTTGPQQTLRRLSGGNQQKVAIGKWLANDSQVLIFDEPTKGVDIKAKSDLFTLISQLAQQGKGVIYASGEFSELVGLCDRICVLWDGRIVSEMAAADTDEETLLLYSTGGTPA